MRHIAIAATVLVLALSVGPMMAHVIPPDEKPLDTDDGTPLEAPTDVETYSGTTVGGPEWDRPGQDPPDQCTNLIAADDDGDGGIGTSNIYTNSV